MAGRELILRFIAFNIFPRKKYVGDIDEFLSNTMMILNEYSETSLSEIIDNFETGLERAHQIFGIHSFRKSMPGDTKKAAINKSLFEVWINALSEIDEFDFDLLIEEKEHFLESYEEILYDEDFSEAVSRRGASSWGSTYRHTEIMNLINGYLI